MTIGKHKQIHHYSHALRELGREISILKSIRWPKEVEEEVIKSQFKKMPKIEYMDLNFDAQLKLKALRDLRKSIEESSLDNDHKNILNERTQSLESVVLMLSHRGARAFGEHSRDLYGSSLDYKKNNITDVLFKLRDNYLRFNRHDPQLSVKKYKASEAVAILKKKILKSFPNEDILIKASSKLNSEASTGKNYIKINKKYLYSENDINIFEVHEAHVHLATNLNVHHQTHAPWLGIHTPKATRTQEGLALFMEFVTQAMTLERLESITHRSKACELAEAGANFLEVSEYFRTNGLSEHDCFKAAQRVFRGTDLGGGSAFTKDLSYVLGFVEIYKFIESMIGTSNEGSIGLLFSGKTSLDEIDLLKVMNQKGEVLTPKYIPELIEYSSILQMKMLFMNLLEGIELYSLNEISDKKVA